MVLADYRMALAGPQGSLDWATLAGRTDSQVGLQVGLEKAVPAGSEPGCTVNLEHTVKPQEQEDATCPHAHCCSLRNNSWLCTRIRAQDIKDYVTKMYICVSVS